METPVDYLQSWQETAPDALRKNHFISEVMADLRQTIPGLERTMRPLSMEMYDIVIGLRHDSGLIYLVDWDSVRFDRPHV